MSLKLIPVEGTAGAHSSDGRKKQKHFNPGGRIKNNGKSSWALKDICLRLVRFINRGSKFTYEQIDELIISLHNSILSLQKQKQEMMKKRRKK